MTIRPKQNARLGMFHLEEAVLDVLLEARHEGDCIGAAEISRRAGIYREGGVGMKGMNDVIVTGVLSKLFGEGKVDRCKQPNRAGGWRLTDVEYATRRDDTTT